MIFLSDGECSIPDTAIQDLCRSAVRLGFVILFPSVGVDRSLTPPEENHCLSIPSPSDQTLRLLPSAGWFN